MPERIQRKRCRGWRMPERAVYVGRPTIYGNPFRPLFEDGRWLVRDDNGIAYEPHFNTKPSAHWRAVELFADLEVDHGLLAARGVDITDLAGHDLACWCPLVDEHGRRVPCHADLLLTLANGATDA